MLNIEKLSLSYGANNIISDCNLSIEQGTMLGLLGANGSGKSTLLRGILGTLIPDSGAVMFEGVATHRWPRKKLARRMTLLSQRPVAPDDISVIKLVEMGRFAHLGYWQKMSEKDYQALDWAMQVTDVTSFKDRNMLSLSGGQQQRVWLAMALAQQVDILLLDEPTTYLDWQYQLEILALLRDLVDRQHLSVIIAMHDLNQAASFCDQLMVMEKGKVVSFGATSDVYTAATLKDSFCIDAQLETRNNRSIAFAEKQYG